MNIQKTAEGEKLTVNLQGRLDTMTAPGLEDELTDACQSFKEIVLDFKELEYISSAGLRVLLSTQKKLTKKQGRMVIKNVDSDIMDIFEVTGFDEILTIE